MAEQPTPNGCRELKRGEPIEPGDVYWICGDMTQGLETVKHLDMAEYYLPGMHAKHFRQITTQKPKETKMTTKPSATTTKLAKVLPKYPKAREAEEYQPTITTKTTKDVLANEVGFLVFEWNKEKREHATTGTKLDRALVDLKEARKRIRDLEAKIGKEASK